MSLFCSIIFPRRRTRGFTCAAALVVSALGLDPGAMHATAANQEWPQFRGPTGQGISAATNVPVRWSATDNVAWKTALPGQGWSSPLVSDGCVYLTTAVGQSNRAGPSLQVLCLRLANGGIIWQREVFTPALAAPTHRKNSPASATAIKSGNRLYVHFGPMGTAALDESGMVLWRQTNLTFAPVHGNGGSPALVGDLLVFNCDGAEDPFVAALDATTGEQRWRTPRNTPAQRTFSFSTPLEIEVKGGRQIISAGSGLVAAYEPAGGREVWRVRYGEGYSVVPRPVFGGGLLFVSSGFDRPVVYAIRPDAAKGDATATHVAWTQAKGAPHTPSLLLAGAELYFVSDGGIATCADARTGQVHWSERLTGNFSASPVWAEGRVYFQSEAGTGYVVKAQPVFELLAINALGARTLASAAVADNCLLLRSEGLLWRIGRGEK